MWLYMNLEKIPCPRCKLLRTSTTLNQLTEIVIYKNIQELGESARFRCVGWMENLNKNGNNGCETTSKLDQTAADLLGCVQSVGHLNPVYGRNGMVGLL